MARPKPPQRTAWTGRRISPAFVVMVGVGMLSLILGLSFLIGLPIRSSLRRYAGQALDATLRSDVATLHRWVDACRKDVQQLDPDQLRIARAILRGEPSQPVGDAWRAPDDRYLGWALVDANRNVMGSNLPDLLNRRLSISDENWSQLAQRDEFLIWPFRAPRAPGDPMAASLPDAVMGVVRPIVDGGRPLGGWVLLMDPATELSACFVDSQVGATGEAIAFNETAQLISVSRFESTLHEQGTLQPGQRSVLNVSLRSRDGSLTGIADQTTRGGTGFDRDGIVDYRGERVMASWQWIPEYQIGLVAKMDVGEVMSAWRWLWRCWVAFLLIVTVAMIAGYFWIGKSNAEDADEDATRRLGQYDLQEMVGKGGMGSVYRGRHQLLRRDVAIKVLEADELGSQAALRFEREVQMTASLRHPNTVDIYDYGRTDDGTFFYVMEFVDGITLQDLVDRFGPQPPGRVIQLILQICGSLAEAHQQGMVHRDIKPSNILITARAGLYDTIKVLDFGLVKIVDDNRELTHTNGITGTPMYMSPESVRDAAMADQRSDLYSVGSVGYTLLTGQPTFDGESSVDVCLKQLKEMPVRPDVRLGRPLPEDLQNVLMSCLQKDPEERPRSIEDLQAALRHCQTDDWSLADAMHWWEVEYAAGGKKSGDSANSPTDLTGKQPRTTAQS